MKNTIHMLDAVTGTQMNSFIITTEGGKVIVIDGGYDQDAEKLIGYLKALTGKEIPHVDAWILSHPHMDHISAFLQIMETMPEALTVDKLYYNFPSVQYCMQEGRGYDSAVEDFQRNLPLFADKVVTVYGFDTYDFGEAHIEILYSPNPEIRGNWVNNSSVVFMLTLGGKKILFLGDAGIEEGNRILALYAGTDKLKADYVQMAHHGQNGVTKEFYETVAPTGCFWCAPDWLWNNDAGLGYNTHCFKTIEVQGWMEEIGVKEHYILMNGTQIVEL